MSVVAANSNLLFENDEWEMNKKLYDLQIQTTLKKRNLDGIQDQMNKLETRMKKIEDVSKSPYENQKEIIINKYNFNSPRKLGNTKMIYDNCTCNKKEISELTKYIYEIKRLNEQKRNINSLIRKYNVKIIHLKNKITNQIIFNRDDDTFLYTNHHPADINSYDSYNGYCNKTINVKKISPFDCNGSDCDE